MVPYDKKDRTVYTTSINAILTNPFRTQHKPKVLMKQSEVYLKVILFSLLLYFFFSSFFCFFPFKKERT